MTVSGNPCPGAGVSQCPDWVDNLLRQLGAPLTGDNRQALWYWAASEGSVVHNNPLAVCCGGVGQTQCIAQCGSSSPIYGFDTIDHGVTANANFIRAGYPSILKALQGNAGQDAIWQAINESAWCKGCQNGRYPNVLYQNIAGAAVPTTGLGALIPGGGSTPPGTQALGAKPGAAGAGAAPNSTCGAAGCVWSLGFLGCVVSHCQMKALTSAVEIAAGGLLGVFGVLLLAAAGLESTKAGQAASSIAGALPGPVGTAAKAVRRPSVGLSGRPGTKEPSGPVWRRSEQLGPGAPPDEDDLRAIASTQSPRQRRAQRRRFESAKRGTSLPGATPNVPRGTGGRPRRVLTDADPF